VAAERVARSLVRRRPQFLSSGSARRQRGRGIPARHGGRLGAVWRPGKQGFFAGSGALLLPSRRCSWHSVRAPGAESDCAHEQPVGWRSGL